MVYALLYISRSRVNGLEGPATARRIVEVSRPRNAALDVTGALIFAESHFAQILEGPRPAVEELMQSILRDPRHHHVEILQEGFVPLRRFPRWSLAYSGPSILLGDLFMSRDQDSDEWAERIAAVMARFTTLGDDG